METSPFVEYSLGLEELALAFGLINRPDLSEQLIKSTYANLTPQQVEERLTAASHSMLARGLTSLSSAGAPQLDGTLEKAIFPLARFDHLFQLSLVIGDGLANVTLHLQKNKLFTAHLVKLGVVHILTHGPASTLSTYLLDVFDQIGTGKDGKASRNKNTISPGMLGKLQSASANSLENSKALVEIGWNEPDAKALADDLAKQTLRGTIVRVDGGQSADLTTVKSMQHENLLLLKGEGRSWLFEFSNTQDDTDGKARMIDRAGFEASLKTFIA